LDSGDEVVDDPAHLLGREGDVGVDVVVGKSGSGAAA
jgi:hypothetical protein